MTNSYLCAVCARLGTVPPEPCHVEETPRASGLWRSLSLVSVPCGPWFCVGQKGPTVETGRKLRLFTTTALYYHSSKSYHPPSKSYHQSNSPLGLQVQKAHTDGQIGDWLTLVELLLQLHPWPPNPHCISSLA